MSSCGRCQSAQRHIPRTRTKKHSHTSAQQACIAAHTSAAAAPRRHVRSSAQPPQTRTAGLCPTDLQFEELLVLQAEGDAPQQRRVQQQPPGKRHHLHNHLHRDTAGLRPPRRGPPPHTLASRAEKIESCLRRLNATAAALALCALWIRIQIQRCAGRMPAAVASCACHNQTIVGKYKLFCVFLKVAPKCRTGWPYPETRSIR